MVTSHMANARETISLAGEWELSLGHGKAVYSDKVTLPGSLLTNGKGNDVNVDTKWTGSLYDMSYYYDPRYAPYREKGNIKFPFFLTPEKEYVGKAYYRRNAHIPSGWKGKRVLLNLERVHIESDVAVNGKSVGSDMSLSTPHIYDITEYMKPGTDNTIEIGIYNGIENVCVGQDSHSVTDQTQGNWNGIIGDISLQAVPRDVSIRNLRVYPDVEGKRLTVKAICHGNVDKKTKATLTMMPRGWKGKKNEMRNPSAIKGDTVVFDMNLGNGFSPWSEFHPDLYDVSVSVGDDKASTVAGMRDIGTATRTLTLNGNPLFIRGTVENCCFPLTGYPPTDVESWARIMSKCKEYGINMIRFHSYCPPEAAFTAADSVGIYLQPEGPSWPNHGVKLGKGMAIDRYLLEESKRIVDAYGNHPSFVMMAAGNEPAGDWTDYCADWVKDMKAYDPTKIYCGASVGGGWQWDYGSEFHVKGGGRGLDWKNSAPQSTDDFMADILRPRHFEPGKTFSDSVNSDPILAHEQGQWCAFPDFSETSQYTGTYKPLNFDIFKDFLYKNGMKGMERKFLDASGRLQTLCYKYEIERNLRTPGYPGFQLLALNDYSGQGTALEGVLNVFWREKGYVDAPHWRQWCSPVVILARLPKFTYLSAESVSIPLEVMNATETTIDNPTFSYRILDSEGKSIIEASRTVADIPVGKGNKLPPIDISLSRLPTPAKYTLSTSLENDLVKSDNSWDFWVFPDNIDTSVPEGIHIATTLDDDALKVLEKGGKVLLTAAGKITMGDDIKQQYTPVFWNTSWFQMKPPHTTGVTIDTAHPLFGFGFPTDTWSNLNWWELVNRAQVINMRDFPADYQSPVQPIDTWHLSRKLGMLVEANVGKGKLLLTTMDIDSNLDRRHVARQMRRALLDYMSSPEFRPPLTLQPSDIRRLFTERAEPVRNYAKDSPDELKPEIKPTKKK